MRVLILSLTPGLFTEKGSSYNGCGWIASLQKGLLKRKDITQGLCFITSNNLVKCDVQNGIHYYPIIDKRRNYLKKLLYYKFGYKKDDGIEFLPQIEAAINQFQPDIIHLFGIENRLAIILKSTSISIPIVVHLQGILNPCQNAFYPPNISSNSFLWPFSKNEWIIGNGYTYAYKQLKIRAQRERELFKHVKYAMGRTKWDKVLLNLYSPKSQYFHVDEILRDEFYNANGTFNGGNKGKFTIVSTISDTVYKGLDLILKTAKELKLSGQIDFEWKIIGISQSTRLVKILERQFNILSDNVDIKYLGVKNADEIVEILQNCNVYVHPSYIDNSPNSICEAQMIGCPIISTNVGGISSLINNGIDGILVPANDPYILASHILNINSNPEKVEILKKEGYKSSILRHNVNKIIESLISSYQEIIDNNNGFSHLK